MSDHIVLIGESIKSGWIVWERFYLNEYTSKTHMVSMTSFHSDLNQLRADPRYAECAAEADRLAMEALG